MHVPPTGPNSFIFAYIFAKRYPHWKSPQWVHAPPTGNPGSATVNLLGLALILIIVNVSIAKWESMISRIFKNILAMLGHPSQILPLLPTSCILITELVNENCSTEDRIQ